MITNKELVVLFIMFMFYVFLIKHYVFAPFL